MSILNAIKYNDITKLKNILDKNDYTCLGSVDSNGYSALHLAVKLCNINIVRDIIIFDCINTSQLFEHGMESIINRQDDRGNTSVHWAVCNNRIDIILELIGAGSNVNIQNCKGNIPLHLAVSKCNVSITRVLLYSDSDINIYNNEYKTPLDIAYYKGFSKIIDEINLPDITDQIDNTISNTDKCIICMEGVKDHACVPCGHKCVCNTCSIQLTNKCPICRNSISDIIRIYDS
jgi:ankyrin repeat protein